jgi:hypothetical protein
MGRLPDPLDTIMVSLAQGSPPTVCSGCGLIGLYYLTKG